MPFFGPFAFAPFGLARGATGLTALAAASLGGLLGAPSATASVGTEALERAGVREVIVRRAAGLDADERTAVRDSVDGRLVEQLRLPRTEVLRIPAGELTEALAALNANGDVSYAEVNAPVQAYSNDSLWPYQWGLNNTGQTAGTIPAGTPDADIDAPEAWQVTSGAGVTVGVVDTGVDFGHPDLDGRLTGNPGELGSGRSTNGIDDDGNGLVDDWRGWDFVASAFEEDRTAGPDNLPEDPEGHGTHVTGTVVATRDNSQGVAGVAPAARVIPLRALDADGSGDFADIADAFDYAGDLGLPVVNASLGGPVSSITLRRAIEAHPGTLFVVAAGNGGGDGIGDDVDAEPEYPCANPAANVLCVGATDNRDRAATFSNFGRTAVDLFAPGVKIASTSPLLDSPCNTYCLSSGTSMASPHAAGVAALVAAARPLLRGAALRQALLDGVDVKAGLPPSVTGGRLNAAGALSAAASQSALGSMPWPAPAPAPSPVAPAPVPAPAPAAAPTPAPVATPAPLLALSQARLSSSRLRGGGSVTLTVRTTRPAALRVDLVRASARRPAATLRATTRTGALRMVIRRRIGTKRLALGRYAVRVVARADGRSVSRGLSLRVG